MGNCGGGVATDPTSKAIDSQLAKDKKFLDKEIKLLLLGPGESGKSTIVKQMKIIHMRGFTQEELKSYIAIVHSNAITAMIALVKALAKSDQIKDLPPNKMEDARLFLEDGNIQSITELTPQLASAIKNLWAEPIVQSRYDNSSDFQIIDAAPYFFNSIDRISQHNYVPDESDVLHARVRTTGITEITFDIGGTPFRMVDVGGQRSERKKWVHCFQDVTAVLFVVSMSEYDQKLREDQSVMRMEESMNLFEEICNCQWFLQIAFILFLNKSDLFETKAARVNLNVCFPDYTGGLDPKLAMTFMKDKFMALNRNKAKKVYSHVTCATNTDNIRFVFVAVQNIVLDKNFNELGI